MTTPYRIDEVGIDLLANRLARTRRRVVAANRLFLRRAVFRRVLPASLAAAGLVTIAAQDRFTMVGPAVLHIFLLGYAAAGLVAIAPKKPARPRRRIGGRSVIVACLLIGMCTLLYLRWRGPCVCNGHAEKGAAQI